MVKNIMKNFENDKCDRIFHITFQYKTRKGRDKQQTVAIKQENINKAKMFFNIWLDIMKGDKPQYVMNDVKIINIKEV